MLYLATECLCRSKVADYAATERNPLPANPVEIPQMNFGHDPNPKARVNLCQDLPNNVAGSMPGGTVTSNWASISPSTST
jgi:hypothetical protein